jgi:hypothetical protein
VSGKTGKLAGAAAAALGGVGKHKQRLFYIHNNSFHFLFLKTALAERGRRVYPLFF